MFKKLLTRRAGSGDDAKPHAFTPALAEPSGQQSPQDPDVAEYTIRTAGGNDWPALPGVDFATLFQPRSLVCEPADGEGDYSFRTGTALVSVSWELAGTWYVTVEGSASPEAADLIVAELAQQLGEASEKTAVHARVTCQAPGREIPGGPVLVEQ
ncbi:hypothetical protein [Streptomyces tanashiensis]|uniref:Uncharacterized protein n=1 Tax=Streptomyces tanashiensis TaxID=67367 RepID=A0ABY6QSW8_9ACTN|nr:hypothetical protein [Streptomyces tanashiensis]UZX19604.1 hypothetical protein LDH80_02110 [Streptomyces tanashiensis]